MKKIPITITLPIYIRDYLGKIAEDFFCKIPTLASNILITYYYIKQNKPCLNVYKMRGIELKLDICKYFTQPTLNPEKLDNIKMTITLPKDIYTLIETEADSYGEKKATFISNILKSIYYKNHYEIMNIENKGKN